MGKDNQKNLIFDKVHDFFGKMLNFSLTAYSSVI